MAGKRANLGVEMDDLEKYIEKRKKADPQFAQGFEEGFEAFKQKV